MPGGGSKTVSASQKRKILTVRQSLKQNGGELQNNDNIVSKKKSHKPQPHQHHRQHQAHPVFFALKTLGCCFSQNQRRAEEETNLVEKEKSLSRGPTSPQKRREKQKQRKSCSTSSVCTTSTNETVKQRNNNYHNHTNTDTSSNSTNDNTNTTLSTANTSKSSVRNLKKSIVKRSLSDKKHGVATSKQQTTLSTETRDDELPSFFSVLAQIGPL